MSVAEYNEFTYTNNIARLLGAKAQPFAISGHIPFVDETMTVFFRSQVRLIESLWYEWRVDYSFNRVGLHTHLTSLLMSK